MYFKFDKLLRQILRHDYFCNVWSKKKLYVLLVALEKLSVLYFSFVLNKGPAVKKKKKLLRVSQTLSYRFTVGFIQARNKLTGMRKAKIEQRSQEAEMTLNRVQLLKVCIYHVE